jgi:hypothetical protein
MERRQRFDEIYYKNNYRVDIQSSADLTLDFLHQTAKVLQGAAS